MKKDLKHEDLIDGYIFSGLSLLLIYAWFFVIGPQSPWFIFLMGTPVIILVVVLVFRTTIKIKRALEQNTRKSDQGGL